MRREWERRTEMSLRKKTILLLGGIFFSLFLIVAVFSRSYLMDSFLNLEKQYVLKNLNQAVGGLNEKMLNMSNLLMDWSSWDNSYDYMANRNQDYVISNMNDETLAQLKLSGVALVDSDGNIVFDKCFAKDRNDVIPIPASIKAAIKLTIESAKLNSGPSLNSSPTAALMEGLINTENGPALIAARQILDSQGKGPSRGIMVMYKYFGIKEIQDLSHMISLSVEVNQVHDNEVPNDYKEAITALKNQGSFVKVLNEDRVGAYTLLDDIYKNQPFILRVDAQRLISGQGSITVNFFMIALVIVGIAITMIILVLLEKLVLHKIKILGDSARRIKESGDLSIRVNLKEKDELGILAENTNAMLDKILEIEKELIKEKNAADAANLEKSAFLANMSHEIRTPMNAIVGMTELLMETNLGEKQRDYAYTVYESGNMLLGIINDVLDFSKIEAGKFSINNTEFEVLGTVESVAELLSVKAHEKHLSLLTYIPVDLPVIKGDPDRIKQILFNLVGNAIKFTERGEIFIKVRVDSYTKNSVTINFYVIDSGIGIEKDHQKKLFQPFIQADASTTRIYGGTGLGLSISKRIVELMNGHIELESELGKGSTFKFQIPFEIVGNKKETEKPLLALKVALISESEKNSKNVELYLKQYGTKEVRVFTDFELGLADILKRENSTEKYDLVILDLKGRLQERYWELPKKTGISSIVLSPYDPIYDNIVPVTLGFSALLIKPYKKAQLLNCVTMLTRHTIDLEIMRVEEDSAVCVDHRKVPEQKISKVLVADDNPVNRKLAMIQLEKLGVEVQMAVNGKEAVELVSKNKYDIVFMDCQMPVMDGFEATKNIRLFQSTKGYRVVIVAMTANAMAGDRERCIAEGMNDYMSKPVRKQDIINIFDKWNITYARDCEVAEGSHL